MSNGQATGDEEGSSQNHHTSGCSTKDEERKTTITTRTTRTATATVTIKVRLYLIRHGESTSNRLGIFAGQQDVPLTEEGLYQAQALGRRNRRDRCDRSTTTNNNDPSSPSQEDDWRDYSFEGGVFSSDLQRAHRTLTSLLESSGRDDLIETIQFDKRLRERSYGAREGMPHTMTEDEARMVWQSRGIEPPIYETDEMVWQRCSEWLMDVLLQIQQEEEEEMAAAAARTTPTRNDDMVVRHVLVSSHAGVLRIMLQRLFSVDELTRQGGMFDGSRTTTKRLVIPNTSVSVIEFEILPPGATAAAASPRDTSQEDDEDVRATILLQTARRLLQLTSTDHLDTTRVHKLHDD